MIRCNRVVATLVLTSLLGGGAAASAQQRQEAGSRMGRGEGMMLGMGLVRAFAPAKLLEDSVEIALSDEQVSRLQAIDDEMTTARDAALAAHDTHRQQLREALTMPSPDPNVVRTHFDAAHAAMGHAHWLGIAAAIRSLAVLSEEQRSRVRAGVAPQGSGAAMREWMGQQARGTAMGGDRGRQGQRGACSAQRGCGQGRAQRGGRSCCSGRM